MGWVHFLFLTIVEQSHLKIKYIINHQVLDYEFCEAILRSEITSLEGWADFPCIFRLDFKGLIRVLD